jgi:dUTP pyrophosphatase
MKIEIVSGLILPEMLTPATVGSGALDLMAAGLPGAMTLRPLEHLAAATGLKVAIPVGYVGLIVPRSSTGVQGLHLSNVVGVIDSDYRGEIIVHLHNTADSDRVIMPTDRVAQLVVVPHFDYAGITVVDDLDATDRGEGGFGSTGV